jgi:uncharacterized protein (DUF1697 family)
MIRWITEQEYLEITKGNERTERRTEALYVQGKFYAHFMSGKQREITPFSCDTQEEVEMMFAPLYDDNLQGKKTEVIKENIKNNNRKCKLSQL